MIKVMRYDPYSTLTRLVELKFYPDKFNERKAFVDSWGTDASDEHVKAVDDAIKTAKSKMETFDLEKNKMSTFYRGNKKGFKLEPTVNI